MFLFVCCFGSYFCFLVAFAELPAALPQMTGQTGSQRFMAPEVFHGMPYNEKVSRALIFLQAYHTAVLVNVLRWLLLVVVACC